jgi:putative tryptophan/tyrosine transport system substrate-binding protein
MARDQAVRLGRRCFLQGGLALTGLTMLSGCGVLPLASHQAARVPRIGFLAVGTREGRAPQIAGLLQGLRDLGYEEGKTLQIEYRFSEDRNERLPELAAELVALRVDLIVASGSPASFAARDATTTIPIVMGSLAADPVETGLIQSLAHPGGNITGMTEMTSQLSVKWLELLKEVVPGLTRVAAFWNPDNPSYGPAWRELGAAAPTLGVELVRLEVRTPEDLEGVFKAATRQLAGALVMPADPLVTNRPGVVADLALRYRLPAIYAFRQFADAGGLLSYGPHNFASYRRAATHVDKILKGAKPGDLPMEQPTVFVFVINLKTARDLGLSMPQSMLQQATDLIQ